MLIQLKPETTLNFSNIRESWAFQPTVHYFIKPMTETEECEAISFSLDQLLWPEPTSSVTPSLSQLFSFPFFFSLYTSRDKQSEGHRAMILRWQSECLILLCDCEQHSCHHRPEADREEDVELNVRSEPEVWGGNLGFKASDHSPQVQLEDASRLLRHKCWIQSISLVALRNIPTWRREHARLLRTATQKLQTLTQFDSEGSHEIQK